ncbi:unnamed protein product [Fraxinus pennsylvanica]|uniref:Cysteine-rich receptor-like protein kinase n=1 Tax=Fraxinus pennsylvanica TaxID=56036 RepID=A0AAD1ZSE2_9LAMI|nr:unnamed protein product [Fraxinus pennsylvanica]
MVGSGAPNTVYGLFLCRGDVNTDACQQCVENATTEVLQVCPKEKRATIWYDYCMLRYSNESIFSRVEQSFAVYLYNTQNITDEPNRFRQLLGETMNEIALEAINSSLPGKKFATKETNFTAFENLYTLAQCTPDLSSGDCDTCLRSAIPQLRTCCDNKKGGRVIGESCNIRYETYPFFNSTVAPAPPPTPNIPPIQPPPPSPSTSSQGNGGISKQVIIAIVVPIAVSLVLFFIGCFFFLKWKKPYDAVSEENDEGNEISSVESLQFDLNTIALATNNFSAENKIGEGGFGSVYKGTLLNGQEIAVKRLSKGNTSRIVGTYGYMSPEYAMHGQFSVKSDVFSFGVLVLEIISGKKNSSFYQSDGAEDLISYAWKLWKDNRPLELMDLTLQNAFARNEVIRCIQIGLLCVQEDVDERPNMTSILLTLNSFSATLAVPRQPSSFMRSRTQSLPKVQDSDKSTSSSTAISINETSISELYPR